MNSLSPERIEQLRQSGIRLDREGRFWHEGEQITHGRFQVALRKWLDLLPDGRTILRLDKTRYAYVDVDDAHLLVTAVRWHDKVITISLNDGSVEELSPETLEQANDSALYCRVRHGKLLARFLTQPYYTLAEHIEQVPANASATSSAHFALRAGGKSYPIACRPSIAGC